MACRTPVVPSSPLMSPRTTPLPGSQASARSITPRAVPARCAHSERCHAHQQNMSVPTRLIGGGAPRGFASSRPRTVAVRVPAAAAGSPDYRPDANQKSENAHPAGQETKGESQASAGSAGDAAAAASGTQQEEPKGVWGKIKAWFAKRKLSKEQLLKMGTSALLSYGFVSNVNAITLLIIAWSMYTVKTGLSPLAAGQWGPYLLTYAALYATFGNLLRPLRLMLAAAISPVFDRIIKKIGAVFHVKPAVATGLTVFFINFCGTLSYLVGGLFLTSLVTGMPILPNAA
mmetsp:Transcript_4031/g.10195  ORF Transcript_4031/g.10195 Transcript_4031/m.10195 type:complete len:288 (+) Transcript_4031:166-1029(+)